MLDTIKEILGINSKPSGLMIQFTCAADIDNLPEGYFRVFIKNGRESLGWRQGNSYNFDCRVPRPVDYDTLPCVQLNLKTYGGGISQLSDGTRLQQIGDQGGNLPGESPDTVEWDDASSGISGREYARRADINQGLW
jgi:hypothetical protein